MFTIDDDDDDVVVVVVVVVVVAVAAVVVVVVVDDVFNRARVIRLSSTPHDIYEMTSPKEPSTLIIQLE